MYLHSAIMTPLERLSSPLRGQPDPSFMPSPLNPFGHEHLKPPTKFSQVSAWMQGFEVWHSLISETQCNPSQKVSEYNLIYQRELNCCNINMQIKDPAY